MGNLLLSQRVLNERGGFKVSQLKNEHTENPTNNVTSYIGGILFTLLISFIGYLLARIPGLSMIGQMGCAIIIAVIY